MSCTGSPGRPSRRYTGLSFDAREAPQGRRLSSQLSQIYGFQIVYPEDDHIIEFYPFLAQASGGPEALPYGLDEAAKAFAAQAAPPDATAQSSPEAVRATFLRRYQELLDAGELPECQDNSITGEGIGSLVSAIATGRRQVCIANVANNGAIPNRRYRRGETSRTDSKCAETRWEYLAR